MSMDINEAVKKAKKFKKQGGVGSTTTKLSHESNDFLSRVLRKSAGLLKN